MTSLSFSFNERKTTELPAHCEAPRPPTSPGMQRQPDHMPISPPAPTTSTSNHPGQALRVQSQQPELSRAHRATAASQRDPDATSLHCATSGTTVRHVPTPPVQNAPMHVNLTQEARGLLANQRRQQQRQPAQLALTQTPSESASSVTPKQDSLTQPPAASPSTWLYARPRCGNPCDDTASDSAAQQRAPPTRQETSQDPAHLQEHPKAPTLDQQYPTQSYYCQGIQQGTPMADQLYQDFAATPSPSTQDTDQIQQQ